jgi:hypothetical protein
VLDGKEETFQDQCVIEGNSYHTEKLSPLLDAVLYA